MSLDNKYTHFIKSEVYTRFRQSREVFRQSVCICIKDPKAQSCVDLHMSALLLLHNNPRHYFDYGLEKHEQCPSCTRVSLQFMTDLFTVMMTIFKFCSI